VEWPSNLFGNGAIKGQECQVLVEVQIAWATVWAFVSLLLFYFPSRQWQTMNVLHDWKGISYKLSCAVALIVESL